MSRLKADSKVNTSFTASSTLKYNVIVGNTDDLATSKLAGSVVLLSMKVDNKSQMNVPLCVRPATGYG